MSFSKGIIAGLAGSLLATAAWASDAHVAPATDFAKSTVKQWISNATVIEAIKAQNAKHAGLSQADIDNMDKDWRAQTDAGSRPMIDAVLGNALSGYLRDQRIPFMSAMAMTQHRDGDDDCSYLELVEVLGSYGSQAPKDLEELFRRIAFTILVSNTDDHFRNHGFLWTGRKGWMLSPLYDVNPVPNGGGILSTCIDEREATASLSLLRSVAEFFVPLARADQVIGECATVTRRWREFAAARQAPEREVRLMKPAYEHGELAAA